MYSGKRPSFNTIKYVPRSSDPVNPAEGEVQYADGTVRPEGLWVYKNGAWTPVGSGSGSALNYILDDSSTFEGSIGSWITYADAAGTSPVDGTGGSANITFARSTSSPLNGTADGLLTKDAADRQGQGISCNFTLDNAYKSRPLKIKFNYAGSANFVNGSIDGVTPSDIQVFMYDVTNAALVSVFPNTLDGSGQFIGEFQASTSTSYRLILHIRSTSALAYTVQVDNFEVSPIDEAFIQSDSDWVSYTPTFTGFGTPSAVDFKYRKEGPDLIIQGKFTSGTSTATEARVSIPSGLVAASNIPTLQLASAAIQSAVSASSYYVSIEPNVAYLTFTNQSASRNALAKLNGDVFLASGTATSFQARIPIQGWTSGYATPGVSAQNVPAVMRAYKSGGAVTGDTTIPSWTSVEKDSVGAFNSTTGFYTIRIPGDYFVHFNFQATAAATNQAKILKNSTIVATGETPNSTARSVSTVLYNLQVGDTISVANSASVTTESNTVGTVLSIYKINDPSAFLTIPKVAYLKDVKASGTDGGTFTSGAWQTRVLNTEEDPFGIVTLSSNQFVLQPGTYKINWSAPAFSVLYHQSKLRNITAGSDTILGQNAYTSGTSDSNESPGGGVFSISVATTFEIQHYCTSTKATDGFGVADAGITTSTTYTIVEIQKLL